MASIKRDTVKQKWEETEFPLVCETCLGDNPYVRMTKEAYGKKCRICEVPFTVFTWQAGTRGRLKKVEICKTCAQTKNVCQVCIFDLQYGLPVQVRDKVLKEYGASSGTLTAPPQSDANLSWYVQSQARALENGSANNNTNVPLAATLKLQQMARLEPHYERNLPKLCTFYAKGECNRGDACPFRHEMPKDRNDPLNSQNTRDRYYGMNDPVAGKLLVKEKEKEVQNQKDMDESSPCTIYVRVKQQNISDVIEVYLREMDVRDIFYSYGEIINVRIKANGSFVEFSSQAAAELAILGNSNKDVLVGNVPCRVSWAKTSKRGDFVAKEKIKKTEAPSIKKKKNVTKHSFLAGFKPSPAVLAAAKKSKIGANNGVIQNVSVAAAPSNPYPSQNPARFGSSIG